MRPPAGILHEAKVNAQLLPRLVHEQKSIGGDVRGLNEEFKTRRGAPHWDRRQWSILKNPAHMGGRIRQDRGDGARLKLLKPIQDRPSRRIVRGAHRDNRRPVDLD
jgi:hypothetical protein